MAAVGEEVLTGELCADSADSTCIRTATKERRSFEFLMQKFSVAIRGNAARILGTLPSASHVDNI